ncbi:uncharacterized protein LOC143423074 [Xylocopa sonorina]|uniref:uncharacterized protein LOC143423074 n=1 Tax=Xylocopa sonorina TaxID=1818115 RepID=UPI00403AB80A
MFRCCLKLFKQTKSRYISWNILFLWGFGLWIALCTSNTYYLDIFQDQEAIEDMLYITTTNYATYNFMLVLKAMLQSVHVFISMSFIIILIYLREYLKEVTKIWINVICDFCTVASFLTVSPRNCKRYEILSKIENENDYTILKTELSINSGITVEHLEAKSYCNDKGDERALEQENKNILSTNIHLLQSEITFNSYTLLLLNNCELHRYFDNQLVKNHLLNNKYLTHQPLKCTKHNTRTSKTDKGGDCFPMGKIIQKGIISSSPEFQTFLANLKTKQLSYPCTLEVSSSYIITLLYSFLVSSFSSIILVSCSLNESTLDGAICPSIEMTFLWTRCHTNLHMFRLRAYAYQGGDRHLISAEASSAAIISE